MERTYRERVGYLSLLWGAALVTVAIGLASNQQHLKGEDIKGFAAVAGLGLAMLAFHIYQRARGAALRPTRDGIEVLRRDQRLTTVSLRQVEPWSKHKALSDLVRGSLLSLLLGGVGVLLGALESWRLGLPVLAMAVVTLALVIYSRLAHWTVEVPNGKGTWLVTLGREDVKQLLGYWPGDR